MDSAPQIAALLQGWLARLAVPPAPTCGDVREIGAPADPVALLPALAALAAEALARERTLWIVTADDAWLPELSNALDLSLRPLCLVLPGAEHAERIALRATLSLLKSRLARDGVDSTGPAWAAMRARLDAAADLWRAALAWNARGLRDEAPPTGVAALFPVRIGPWTVAERAAAPADWVMLAAGAGLPERLRTAWPGAQRTLLLGAAFVGGTALAQVDACRLLRAELEVLGQELAEMELEFATAQGELAAFSADYHARVAWRIAEFDRIEADLAELRLREAPDDAARRETARAARERAAQSDRERAAHAGRSAPPPPRPFAPGNDLKKRFRQLAQKIHPDRACDEADRAWRTQLMSEANRAYRAGDLAALDEVFALWLEGPQARRCAPGAAVSPAPTSAEEARLAAEAARIRKRIAAIAADLDRLYGSKLYELFAAHRVAARQGRDLLAEMAARLDAQIDAARAELDRLSAASGL